VAFRSARADISAMTLERVAPLAKQHQYMKFGLTI
jgi:hypothetical protein